MIAGSTVIAVLTYKRPEDIALAIPRLQEQLDTVGGPASVLVVDNDPAGSARATVEGFASPRIRYVHEPRPGIAAARNRALAESAGDSVLVFIDDDEVPTPDWLRTLLTLHRETAAAAVVGPVVSEYARTPERWIQEGRFFDRRRLRTGTRLTVAATNNLLLDLAQIRALGLAFDERFGLSGGSDTLFTRKLARLGGLMLWCDEAAVIDRVPESRLTRSWVLRRALRSGNSAARVSLELAENTAEKVLVRARHLASGTVRIAGGGARLLAGAVTGSMSLRARGLRTIARGTGMASGAFGYVYSEYKRK
ncbi:glycosyl transferase family 2 [Arthrobacter sp. SW1]|uniref:glycosyltransferase family 2 protein n=1 Tax=Arthrobacter sp. SW1 TaxID=1920889 RepID=UPI000877C322|nr:glycosyltransferase [Arthrobacter sp. SW1]OFI38954.1 glycosyl transferase family 2 [Arthrobacter sp. SW1]